LGHIVWPELPRALNRDHDRTWGLVIVTDYKCECVRRRKDVCVAAMVGYC
jgi:hypothetical protein